MSNLSLTLSLLDIGIAGYLLIAIAVHVISLLFTTFLIQQLLKYLEQPVHYLRVFLMTSIGNLIHYFAPLKAGHFIGRPLVGKLLDDIPIRKTLSTTAFEHFINFSMYLIAFPFFLLILGETLFITTNFVNWLIISIFVITTGILAYHYQWFLPKLFTLKKYVPEKVRKIFSGYGLTEQTLEDITQALPKYFKNKRLVAIAWSTTIILMLLQPLFLWAALDYFNQHLSYLLIIALYWVSYVIGRLSLLPAGIGVKDVTLAGLLISLNMNPTLALKVVIVYRLLSLVPVLLIGGTLLLIHAKTLLRRQHYFFKKTRSRFIPEKPNKH